MLYHSVKTEKWRVKRLHEREVYFGNCGLYFLVNKHVLRKNLDFISALFVQALSEWMLSCLLYTHIFAFLLFILPIWQVIRAVVNCMTTPIASWKNWLNRVSEWHGEDTKSTKMTIQTLSSKIKRKTRLAYLKSVLCGSSPVAADIILATWRKKWLPSWAAPLIKPIPLTCLPDF